MFGGEKINVTEHRAVVGIGIGGSDLDPVMAYEALRHYSQHQWGVELGKALAERTIPELESAHEPRLEHDSSTNALIRRYRSLRGTR